jgi:DNA polymerase III alpha subunit (gram-positive type)
MSGYIIYVVDTETTGFDPISNDIIEISMIRAQIDNLGEVHQEQKTWYLKALNAQSISEEALAVNGHLRNDILHFSPEGRLKYRNPDSVITEIEQWMSEDEMSSMDRIFVGQNPIFDVNFLQQLWTKNNCADTFPFQLENNNRILDTKQIAVLIDLCTGRRRLRYNLSSLVKAFGVKKGKAHQASEDTRMTIDLLLTFLNPMKDILNKSFKDSYLPDENSL